LYRINLGNIAPPFATAPSFELKTLLHDRGAITLRYIDKLDNLPFSNEPVNETGRKYKTIIGPIDGLSKKLLFLADEIHHQWVPITRTAIRENMAKMAEWSIRKKAQKDILPQRNQLNPIYFVIFDHIRKMALPYDNVKLTYFVCETALMSPKPEERLNDILSSLPTNLSRTTTFEEAIMDFSAKMRFHEQNSLFLENLEKILRTEYDLFKSISSELAYMKIINSIYDLMFAGLQYRRENMSLYTQTMDARWIEATAARLGSPLTREADGSTSLLHQKQENFTFNSDYIAVFFANNFVLDHMMTRDKVVTCPFFQDYPICGAESKTEDICVIDPMSIRDRPEFIGCPLWNGLKACGVFS
jgi:hypothetical protein